MTPKVVPSAAAAIVGVVPGGSSLSTALAAALVFCGSCPYSGAGSPKSPGSSFTTSSSCWAAMFSCRSRPHSPGIGVSGRFPGDSSLGSFSSSDGSDSSLTAGSGSRGECMSVLGGLEALPFPLSLDTSSTPICPPSCPCGAANRGWKSGCSASVMLNHPRFNVLLSPSFNLLDALVLQPVFSQVSRYHSPLINSIGHSSAAFPGVRAM